MPVKCPICSIVKQRKSHGRDYFEVAWEDMHGLKVSVVPADLVESACPEKIQEFQQRKALKKRPKPKRVENRTEMKNVGNKLHDLTLELNWEQERIVTNDTVIRGGLVPEMTVTSTYVDLIDQKTFHCSNTEISCRGAVGGGSSNGVSFNSGSYPTVGFHDSEIIDLMSPSPPRHTCTSVSKYREVNCIDVIELSESDNDVSPDHARKARELRSFIASISD